MHPYRPMETPLPLDEVLEYLKYEYREHREEELPQSWLDSVDRMMCLANNSHHGPAKKLESFSKDKEKENLVKVFDIDVPEGILPDGYSAKLHDIKVKSSKNGPDDSVYNNNPDIRKWVARGTTTMELKGPESWYDVIIYANKKFTGGVGDEDENQPNNDDLWREYCLAAPETAHKIICTEKLNGDAVHFSGRYIGGRFYLFAGSKTTHMLIRNKNDIRRYTDARYEVARRFAAVVCDTLDKLDGRVRHILYSFLHHTKTTAICEVLQPKFQHIVDLSYLEDSELNMIAFTPTAVEDEETTLTAFPPQDTLDIMKILGFAVASYTIIEQNDIMTQREKIRTGRHTEGQVLYYLNEKGETFGIAKAKSVWYVYLRALREKAVFTFVTAKKRSNWNLYDRIKSMWKRFDEIQVWLKLSEDCVRQWKDLGEKFLRWMEKEIDAKRIEARDIRPQFPCIWKRFLSDEGTESADIIPL